ncbi:MAG: DUF5666 domain-containing protein [Candidatus Caldarchaeum sp.]
MLKRDWMCLAFVSLCGMVLFGCSGGSGGGGGVLSFFLSDSFRDDYRQVWMTLFKVELRDANTGEYRTAFESAEGILFDARRLSDGSGPRFQFLGNGSLTSGAYNGVRVSLKDEVILVPAGSNVADPPRTFSPNIPRDALGRAMLAYDLPAPVSIPGETFVVVDFDLASFSLDGNGNVVAVLRAGSSNGIDDRGRHEIEDYEGLISGLNANRFRLSAFNGVSFMVEFDSSTVIFRESGGSSATLSNGLRVEVTGFFLPGMGVLRALQIKIEDGNSSQQAEAKGEISDVDLSANRMILNNIREVENFLPQGSTLNVVWTGSTVFRRSGEIVNESWLLNFPIAEVKGSYDAATNTLTATRITLEDEFGPGAGEAEARGRIQDPDVVLNRMILTNLRDVEGFTPLGDSVIVTWTDGGTIFRRRGDLVTENELLNFPFAQVKGRYDAGTNTIQAIRITLEDN